MRINPKRRKTKKPVGDEKERGKQIFNLICTVTETREGFQVTYICGELGAVGAGVSVSAVPTPSLEPGRREAASGCSVLPSARPTTVLEEVDVGPSFMVVPRTGSKGRVRARDGLGKCGGAEEPPVDGVHTRAVVGCKSSQQ